MMDGEEGVNKLETMRKSGMVRSSNFHALLVERIVVVTEKGHNRDKGGWCNVKG